MHHLLKQIGVEFQKVQNFQHKDSNEFRNRLLNLIESIESLILSLYSTKTEKNLNGDDDELSVTNNDHLIEIIVNLSDLINFLNLVNIQTSTETKIDRFEIFSKYSNLIINFAEKTVKKLIYLLLKLLIF